MLQIIREIYVAIFINNILSTFAACSDAIAILTDIHSVRHDAMTQKQVTHLSS
jgi:hypothetical protein